MILTSLQILYTSSNEDLLENVRVQQNDNFIIGRSQILLEITGKKKYTSITKRRIDNPDLRVTQKNMYGLSKIVCSWTISRRSKSFSILLEENEIDTKINLYEDDRTRRIRKNYQFTKILKRKSNHVLRWFSIENKETRIFTQVRDSDKGSLTSSYAVNSSGNVSNGVISVEHRRRRHRHRQRHGGNRNNGKNTQQWQGRQDWHGWQEWNEWVQISWSVKSLCKFLYQSVAFSLDISRADIGDCRARDGWWKQNTSSDAAHTYIFHFARRAAQLFHLFTFHSMHLHWLKAWWLKSACESCVKNIAAAPLSFFCIS